MNEFSWFNSMISFLIFFLVLLMNLNSNFYSYKNLINNNFYLINFNFFL